jgi:outer membrane receptor protein involved in Fe transport
MNIPMVRRRPGGLLLLAAFSLVLPRMAEAQQAKPAVDAAALARYDANKNGQLDSAELAQMQAAESRQGNAPIEASAAAKEEVIDLSPFTVVSDDRGYQASNTLSGTRLNSKLEDLGASITVVTMQQMLDTAVLDINDVMRYEASTEGTDNFTTYNRNRTGGVNDQVQSNPQQSNRIRGISQAGQTAGGSNTAWGNFRSNNGIPFDLYNVAAIEVSRGPNSNLFGLGAAAGTINVVPTQANLERVSASATLRFDDWGGNRQSINFNQPIIPGKLALRIAAVNENKGFTRKPSSERIHRQFATLLARPFKNTQLRVSAERYHNEYRRPNSITPRDTTTEWKANGSPTWDPVARVVTFANGTKTAAITNDALLPTGLIGGYNGFYNSPGVYIDNHAVQFFTVQKTNNPVTTALPTNPFSGGNSTLRYLQSGTDIMRRRDILGPTGLPLYLIPGTGDKSVYDWSSVNAVAPNNGIDDADTFSIELEQIFLNTPSHLIAGKIGHFYQEYQKDEMGAIDNLESVIYVDVNEKLLDGSPNPYFKRPYIQARSPSRTRRPQVIDIQSADLAYQFSPRNLPRWLSWVGQQRLGLHAEVDRSDSTSYTTAQRVTSDNVFINKANRIGTQNIAQRYYLGDNQGQNVDYGPSITDDINGTYPFTWFNNRTGVWTTEPVSVTEELNSGQGARQRTETRTFNATLQSFFLNDRLVTTVGFRRDRQRSRTGAGAFINSTTGLADLSNTNIFGPAQGFVSPSGTVINLPGWAEVDGDTKTYGAVLKATRWLNFHFNKSDSFAPQVVRQSLGLGNVPNPEGFATEWGVSFAALEGKLNVRINRFTTKELNSRGSEIGTLGNRYLDMEGRPNNANQIQTPSFRYFATNIALGRFAAQGNNNPSEAQMLTAVAALMGQSEEWLSRLIYSGPSQPQTVGTTDVSSKGFEIEATYNPTRNWRLKVTGSQTQAQDDRVSPEIYDWWQSRIPVWTTLRSDIVPGDGKGPLWWNTIPPGDTRTPETRFIADQWGPFWAAATNEGRPRSQIREYRFTGLTNYDFTTGRLKNFNIGGAVRWESKASIGFGAAAPETSGPYAGTVLFLDNDKPYWDKARAYFDFSAGYKFKLRNDKIRAKVQLNVRDIFEGGRLQAVGVNPDGNAAVLRIINPRQFILTTTFDL